MAPSDRYTRDHLALAELHLAEGADRLARQEEAAARCPRGSAGRATAEDLLATMRQTMRLMLAHRAAMLRELAGDGPGFP